MSTAAKNTGNTKVAAKTTVKAVPKSKAWKNSTNNQVSSDLLWALTRNYNSYLVKNHGLTLSRDPLNLSGLNLQRDSGIAHPKAIGITFNSKQGTVKEKKAKKKADIVRLGFNVKTKRVLPKNRLTQTKENAALTNNTVYTGNQRVTARAVVKALHRNLANYRSDLLPLAFKRLRRINKFKKLNKYGNKAEAKKVKA